MEGVKNEGKITYSRALPIQRVRDSKTDGGNKYATLFSAKVPALGYSVFRAFDKKDEGITENLFEIGEDYIANSKIKLSFDKESGEVNSIFDISKESELLCAPTEIALYNDEKHDTWAHGVKIFDEKVPYKISGKITVIEQGPVRAAVRSEQTFGNSTIIRDYYIYADSDNIDVRVKIDFHEKFRILKLVFPCNTENAKAYCKIPYGYIERPTDGSEQVCQDWICMSDKKSGIGVASDCKHSFDANGNMLSLTVLRSALFADHYGQRDDFCEFMEQGEHFFKYRIFPFTDFADAELRSTELQNPPVAIVETFHSGKLKESYSGVSVKDSNIVITSIKEQEDGNGYILRCYESGGIDTHTHITLFDKSFDAYIPHNAIKTFCINDGNIEETDFIE